MSHRFTLQLLGGISLRDRLSGADVRLVQPRITAILAFLATAPRGRRRDEIISLLWPDVASDRARHSFNQLLYLIRQELGADAVRSRGMTSLVLDEDVIDSDVCHLERAIRAGRWEEAAGLGRREFLPGFRLPGGPPEFEQWLDAERTRLRRACVEAALRASSESAAEGRLRDAVRWSRDAHGLAPWDEAIARRIIELLDQAGNRAEAIHFYQSFVDRLRTELDLDPSAETSELVRRLEELPIDRARGSPDETGSRASSGLGLNDAARSANVQAAEAGARTRSRWPRQVTAIAVVVLTAIGLVILNKWPDRVESLQIGSRIVFVGPDGPAEAAPASLEGVRRSLSNRMRQVLRSAPGVDVVDADGSVNGADPHIGLDLVSRGDSVRIHWILRRGRTRLGDVSGTIPAGMVADPLIAEMEQRMLGLLALRRHPRMADWLAPGATPPLLAAQLAFEQSIEAQFRYNEPERMAYLERAAQDTLFLLPLLELAHAWVSADDLGRADSAFAVLDRQRERLLPEELDYLNAARHKRQGHPFFAHADVSAAARKAPSRFGFMFAEMAIRVGDYAEGLEYLERLDTTSSIALNYPQVLAWALHGSGRFDDELRLARAIESPRQMRDALAALGRVAELDSLFRTREVERLGWSLAATFRLRAGRELLAHGHDSTSAIRLFEEAVVYRNRRNVENPGTRSPAEEAFYFAGQLDSARVIYQRCLDRSRASSRNASNYLVGFANNMLVETGGEANPDCLVGLALVAAREGKVAEARALAAELVAMIPGTDPRYPDSLVQRARIATMLGDLDEAALLIQQALSAYVFIDRVRVHAFEFRHLVGHPVFDHLMKGGFM